VKDVWGRSVSIVYVGDLWRTVPIFHALKTVHELGEWSTICGLPIFDIYGGNVLRAFPPGHAVKFGRPCKRCFGGGSS
jgi:hypothetical protein